MFGENTLGSVTDHQRWVDIATRYLSNHYRGIFYADPQTDLELKTNESKLEDLQSEQTAILRELFELNPTVFRQIADTLIEKRSLNREALIPFLSQVKLPNSFPHPIIG
jgi:hypothetical protein